jgi:hypothetical protein
MKGISQDEHRGFNKYKLNYAYVNRAGIYEHWKCEKCDNLFGTSKELRRHKQVPYHGTNKSITITHEDIQNAYLFCFSDLMKVVTLL